MKKRKRIFGGSEEESEEMTLQITSMADIFTIILVFLLKSFSSGMASIAPSQPMLLPTVDTGTPGQIRESLKLEITADAVLVDQKPVAALSQFAARDDEALAKSVLDSLLKERRKSVGRDPAAEDGEMDSHLVVMADEQTPYSTLKSIMNSAATAGYVDLQLVVLKPE